MDVSDRRQFEGVLVDGAEIINIFVYTFGNVNAILNGVARINSSLSSNVPVGDALVVGLLTSRGGKGFGR